MGCEQSKAWDADKICFEFKSKVENVFNRLLHQTEGSTAVVIKLTEPVFPCSSVFCAAAIFSCETKDVRFANDPHLFNSSLRVTSCEELFVILFFIPYNIFIFILNHKDHYRIVFSWKIGGKVYSSSRGKGERGPFDKTHGLLAWHVSLCDNSFKIKRLIKICSPSKSHLFHYVKLRSHTTSLKLEWGI